MSEKRIIRAAERLAQTSPERQIEALRKEGFSEGESHRLIALLPLAFSRPILEDLGVAHFVPIVTATAADGTPVEALLMHQPEYVVGLKVARKHRRGGIMDHEVYEHIASGSAEINAVDNALNAGTCIEGSTVASSLIGPSIAQHLIR